jgi:hypothetical protein
VRGGIAAAIALVLLAPALRAQGSITGTVVDSGGRGIAGAEVLLQSPVRRVRADSLGRFTLAGLKAGRYALTARRFGYFPTSGEVRVKDGEASVIALELDTRPVLLDTVTVTSNCGRFEYEGFLCRQRKARGGVFMDIDQIDSANARFPADLFRRPGWRVEAVGGGLRAVPLTGWRCMTALVNGMPVSRANPMPRWPNEMLGLEIYANPDSVPREYAHYAWGSIRAGRRTTAARCSLVVYWTTVRPNR